jgi:hypothetical protein
MSIKRNAIAGGAIAVVAASVLFTVGQRLRRKPQADWNREQWLHLLSGANGVSSNRHKPHQVQTDWNQEQWLRLLSGSNGGSSNGHKPQQAQQAGWNQEQWLRLISGSSRGYHAPGGQNGSRQNGQVKPPSTPAEFIGRTGYQLYR